MFAEIAAGANAIGSLASAFGGSKSPSRKRERDSYTIAAESQRENIGPWLKAVEAAGIHPLIGMGQNPVASPAVSVGGGEPDTLSRVGQMGQGVARAASVLQNSGERQLTQAATKLQLENMSLQNDLLRSQITSINRPTTPPLPGSDYNLPGQTSSGVVNMLKSDQIMSEPGQPHRQAGTINTYQVDSQGGVIPSEQMKSRIEDDFVAQSLWHLKNRLVRDGLPDGRIWNPVTQSYMKDPLRGTRARRWLNHIQGK